ncbi:hypothetical protein D3C72_2455630 [compost metagenome]
MKGMRMPNQSFRIRLTVPLRPKSSCMATAPTNGGMISGMKPSVWMISEPRKSKRVVKTASGKAMALAQTTDMPET